MPLSGPAWISLFPTSRSLTDLAEPFQTKATQFISALRAASATVTISDTLRPPQRVHLMHYSFAIAREALDPATVPALAGVDIQWVHTNAASAPDPVASRTAAEQMVQGYGIVFKPSLTTRHTEGNAVDMNITWSGNLVITKADGTQQTISSPIRTGAGNADLHQVGAGYGVFKLLTDPPHWSSDGH